MSFIAWAVVLVALMCAYPTTLQKRKSRSLVFPPTTVFQLVFAVSTPFQVPNRTLGISVGFQLNFVLPSNASELHPQEVSRHRRDANLYRSLEEFLEQAGFNGSACLLRTICEAAYAPFHWDKDDLLHEILHLVLRPSEQWTVEGSSNSDVRHYLEAELLGESLGDCQSAFSTCNESLLKPYTTELMPA